MKRTIVAWLMIGLLTLCGCAAPSEELGVGAGAGNILDQEQEKAPQPQNPQGDQSAEPDQGEQQGQTSQQNPSTPSKPSQGQGDLSDAVTDGEYDIYMKDQSGTKLKILCQNLRIDSMNERGSTNDIRVRRHRFKWLVEKYDPDVVGMQEVDATWMDILPQDFGGEYTIYFYGRDQGGVGEGTPVMWKTAKYKKIKEGYFWLSNSPSNYSESYDSGGPRIVNWVTLRDKETGTEFTLYSTHLGFYKSNASYQGIYQQILKNFNANKGYSFWMGDFNIGYRNKAYLTMVDGKKVIDLWPLAEAMKLDGHCTMGEFKNGSYNGFTMPEGAGVYGDFIWAKADENMAIDHYQYCYEMPAVEEKGVEAGYVSDHFAVYAEVRLDTAISYKPYYNQMEYLN